MFSIKGLPHKGSFFYRYFFNIAIILAHSENVVILQLIKK